MLINEHMKYKLSRVLIVIIYSNVYDKVAQIIASYVCYPHCGCLEGAISEYTASLINTIVGAVCLYIYVCIASDQRGNEIFNALRLREKNDFFIYELIALIFKRF